MSASSRRRNGKRSEAAQSLATTTTWTDWKGLPGHTQVHQWMREKADWTSTPVAKGEKNRGAVAPALASAAKTLKASYELPYMKHAPIGPTIAVGDVRPDGTVFVHTHNQNPQALRGQIAMMLGTPVDDVVIRIYAGPGHYGRSNGGNAGAEDEAVILSQAVGQPVRVQWMRPEDLQWSTQSPAAFSDIRIGVDAQGIITAYEANHYMPAGQDDRLDRRHHRRTADTAGARRQQRPDRIDVQLDSGSVALRAHRQRGRIRVRHVPDRPARVAA